MEAGGPLVIEDLKTTSLWKPGIDSLFPSRSILGIPLTIEGNNLASLILGYNQKREFAPQEIAYAEIAAQQIAIILTKLQLLQYAQIQVKQLTALHEVAIIATEAETLDELIERVTEVIGKSLFPDNFGILLMDQDKGVLRSHPSYRFTSGGEMRYTDIPLGLGVSGQVAQTGVPIRAGNILELDNYLDTDPNTQSELCVPIKLKERILGVINAESTRRDTFTGEDEVLLGTLAGQLATAIEQLRSRQSERGWLDQLAHSNELIYSLAHITTHIEKAPSPDEIIQTLGDELKKIGLTCIVSIHNTDRNLFSVNYTSLETETLEQFENMAGFPLLNSTFSLMKLKSVLEVRELSQPLVISNPQDEIQILFDHRRKVDIVNILGGNRVDSETELLRLPLMFEEQLLGILWVWGNGIARADLPILSIFAKQIGISLERARLFQEVQSLALTDPLTGLQNRRSLFELGRIEFSRAQRMERPFCCMMLDLDHFKKVNDSYGHQIGDQVLQEFAKRCVSTVRAVDLVGRYGGEEFIILLPETDRDTAVRIAERLRTSIAEKPMKISDVEVSISTSIGVATNDENTPHLEALIARADQALFIAKHRGRDRVAVSR
jgi:diguanylate cyclase (GGDEF)-like protein